MHFYADMHILTNTAGCTLSIGDEFFLRRCRQHFILTATHTLVLFHMLQRADLGLDLERRKGLSFGANIGHWQLPGTRGWGVRGKLAIEVHCFDGSLMKYAPTFAAGMSTSNMAFASQVDSEPENLMTAKNKLKVASKAGA